MVVDRHRRTVIEDKGTIVSQTSDVIRAKVARIMGE